MTQTLADTSDTYLNWVNTEAITYTTVDPGGSNSDTEISHARSFRMNEQDVALLGGTRGARSWRVPKALFAGPPRKGDKFTDAGSTVWFVEHVEYLRRKEQWRLLCVEKKG